MDATDSTRTAASQAPEHGASIPISDAIDRLLANPELISMVASAIGMGAPSTKASTQKEESEPSRAEENEQKSADEATEASAPAAAPSASLPDAITALAPLLGNLYGDGKKFSSPHDDNRACLLRALKPYVSHGRAEAIDTILQLARISELLKKIT